jgi:hypothetical protein
MIQVPFCIKDIFHSSNSMRVILKTSQWPSSEQVLNSLTKLQFEFRFLIPISSKGVIMIPGTEEYDDIEITLQKILEIEVVIEKGDDIEPKEFEQSFIDLVRSVNFSTSVRVISEQ